jgi:hypothetical protein
MKCFTAVNGVGGCTCHDKALSLACAQRKKILLGGLSNIIPFSGEVHLNLLYKKVDILTNRPFTVSDESSTYLKIASSMAMICSVEK